MDRLIYTALSGMQASMDRQRAIASNMANTNTLGFRAELIEQRAMTVEGHPNEARAMQVARVTGADMRGGEIMETGRELDIAMATKSLMAVQAENGDEAYTRRGDLSLSATGLLVTGDGHPVLGDTGPITVPPGGRISISDDGTVTRTDPDAPEAPPAEVGRIKLARPSQRGWTGCFAWRAAASCRPTKKRGCRPARSNNPTSNRPKCWSP